MRKRFTNYRVITVYCKCGSKLVKYMKGGKGRLLKFIPSRISKDFVGIFLNNYYDENTDIFCPNCNNRIATVKIIGGNYVYKINQGSLGDIKK